MDKILSPVISDLLYNGESRSFATRKRYNLKLAYSYMRLSEKAFNSQLLRHANEVYQCHRDSLFACIDGHSKLLKASHCTDKLCPLCGVEKSRKVFSAVLNNIEYNENNGINKDRQYCLITLTVRNVPGEKLRSTVDRMNAAFFNLQRRKSFVNMSYGSIRCFEVTYNAQARTFHPHIHILVSLKPGYFDLRKGLYLTHAKLLEEWQHVMADKSISQVNIKKVKGNSLDDLKDSVCEVAKYPFKMVSIFNLPDDHFDEVVSYLYTLKGCRFIQGNGCFSRILHFVSNSEESFVSIADISEYEDENFRYVWLSENMKYKVSKDSFFVRIHWRCYGLPPDFRIGNTVEELLDPSDKLDIPIADISEADYDIKNDWLDRLKFSETFEI